MKKVVPTFVVLALAGVVRAQDPSPPPMWPVNAIRIGPDTSPPTDQTRDLVKRLTSPDFPTRDAASEELAEKGTGAFPGLESVVKVTDDFELKARTADYFGPDNFRVPAGVPIEVATLIRAYEQRRKEFLATSDRGMDLSVDFLLPSGMSRVRESQLLLFYDIILSQEKNSKLHGMLEGEASRNTGSQVRMLIASGRLDKAQQMLRSELWPYREPAPDYAALRALREGVGFDPERELNKMPIWPSPQLRATMGILLFRAAGDAFRAADFATSLKDQYAAPGRLLLIQNRRYEDLAKLVQSSLNPNSLDLLTVARLMGRSDDVQEQIARIAKDTGPNAASTLPPINLDLYLLADRAEEAIRLSIHRKDPRNAAFHVLCQQLRVREALAAITDRKIAPVDLARQLSDMGLTSEARRLLHDSKPESIAPERNYGFSNAFLYASELDHAGAHREAADWRSAIFAAIDPDVQDLPRVDAQLAALDQELEGINAQAASIGDPFRDAGAAQALTHFRQAASKIDAAKSPLSQRREILKQNLTSVSFRFEPGMEQGTIWEEASFWYGEILWNQPLDAAKRYEKAIRVARGELSDSEVQWLIDQWPSFVKSIWNSTVRMGMAGRWVSVLHRMRRDDQARKWVLQLVQDDNDPTYLILLGDLALDKGENRDAANYYQRAATVNLTDASLMYRLGLALSRDNVRDAGEALMNYAPFLVLGDASQALNLAQSMRRFQGDAQANEWYDAYVSRFTAIGDDAYAEVIVRARDRAVAKGDYAGAFQLQTEILFNPRSLASKEYNWVMATVADYHRFRALDAWQRHDLATLADALNRQLDNGPPDADLLEKALPALQSAGGPDLAAADEILTRAIDRLKPVVEDYPEATQYKDQLTRLQKLGRRH